MVFGHLSPRYVIGARGNVWRARDADCSGKIDHAILYEVPGAPQTRGDEDMPLFFRVVMSIATDTICSRFDGDPAKGYSVRDFLPDGRQLLREDRPVANGRATIVPAAPVDSLIKPPPPAPATPQP